MVMRINIKSDMLTWAINRAGFELPVFVNKYPKVHKWITKEEQPTVKQLEDFSKKVHLPFGYLLLDKPPAEELPIPYYRNNADNTKIDINIYDTIILMQQRQDWLKNYLIDNGADLLPFVSAYRGSEDVSAIVNDIRRELSLPENWASEFKTWTDAQNYLVDVIESRGIIVVFNGVVENNTHRKIPVDQCRGFVLVDPFVPFMFINNADFRSAQMFTIMHEIAHVWTGYSAGFDFRKLHPAADPIEILCDKIAAEFLVPEKAFLQQWKIEPDRKSLARHFKVSEIVIARRALDTGVMSAEAFFNFYEEYKRREYRKSENKKSGGDFFATARKRISMTFASHVNQAVQSGQLLYRDACKLTGFKGDTYEKFFSQSL